MIHAALRGVLPRYAASPLRTRLHIYGRLRSLPLAPILAALPREGVIASLGCGHGAVEIAALLEAPARSFVVHDIDEPKLAALRMAAQDLPLRVLPRDEFVAQQCDALLITDVLYLLTATEQQQVLQTAFAMLRPGGRIILKEMDTVPRTKALWNRMQEFLALRVLRITRHRQGACGLQSAAEQCAALSNAGFMTVQATPLHGGFLHPHLLLTARKP